MCRDQDGNEGVLRWNPNTLKYELCGANGCKEAVGGAQEIKNDNNTCAIGQVCRDQNGNEGTLRWNPTTLKYELCNASGCKEAIGGAQQIGSGTTPPVAGVYYCDNNKNCGYSNGKIDDNGNIILCNLNGASCFGVPPGSFNPSVPNDTTNTKEGCSNGVCTLCDLSGGACRNVNPEYYQAIKNMKQCGNPNGCSGTGGGGDKTGGGGSSSSDCDASGCSLPGVNGKVSKDYYDAVKNMEKCGNPNGC